MKKFGSYVAEKSIYEFCNEPLFYQNEYFNVYFQKSIEEFKNHLDLHNILVTTAQEICYSQLSYLFQRRSNWDSVERKKFVEEYFSYCGLGKIDLTAIQAKGGCVNASQEHFASAWLRHFSKRTEHESGVSFFALGFLIGAVESIFNTEPGVFTGRQLKCISKGDEYCRFEIYRGLKKKINTSPQLGRPDSRFEDTIPSRNSLVKAFVEMDVNGLSSDDGLIKIFDTTFTRLSVNYLAMVTIKLLMLSNKKIGPEGFKRAKEIIHEVSEANATFTIAKIFNSETWVKLLAKQPEISGQSHLKNAFDLQTAFGLGSWELEEGTGSKVKVTIKNSPITNAYLKLVGNTKASIGYYHGATVIGTLNLIKKGFIVESGVDINFVDQMTSQNPYEYAESESRMVGNDDDIIIASQT